MTIGLSMRFSTCTYLPSCCQNGQRRPSIIPWLQCIRREVPILCGQYIFMFIGVDPHFPHLKLIHQYVYILVSRIIMCPLSRHQVRKGDLLLFLFLSRQVVRISTYNHLFWHRNLYIEVSHILSVHPLSTSQQLVCARWSVDINHLPDPWK